MDNPRNYMKNITMKNIKDLVKSDTRFDGNKISKELDWLKDYVDLRFDVLNELIHFKTEEIMNKIDQLIQDENKPQKDTKPMVERPPFYYHKKHKKPR
tara:strand:- start:90 stop:383 length:294 start_codon:yes stop_codon:yes gene_type:complete